MEARIKAAFDVSQISKELNAKGHFLLFFPVFLEAELLSRRPCIFVRGPRVQIPYSSRTNERDRSTVGKCAMEPVIISDRGHGWRMRQSLFLLYLFFWAHVDCCDLQVYTLEKVLKLKKDPVSQIVFLDEAMKVGLEVLATLMSLLTWLCRCWKIGPAQFSGLPWHERWKSRPGTGQKVRDLSSESGVLFDHLFEDSTFLQQTLSSGYPKFLRLFHKFFSKIAVHTDTVYTQVRQRSACAFQCTLRLTYTPFQPRNRPCSSCPFNLRSVVPITRIQQDE